MQYKKIKVAVLMGGRSPEYEISLISGQEVVKNLNKEKFDIIPVVISRNGQKWQLISPQELLNFPNPLSLKGTGKELAKNSYQQIQSVNQISDRVDVIFIAMHGPFGEDGTVQGMLELAGLPYTGSGVLASALGMDKLMFRKVMISKKIPIPKYVALNKSEKLTKIFNILPQPPYFVKPCNQGSSVAAGIVKKRKDLAKAINKAHQFSEIALIDEYIKGLEVTCGIIGNKNPIALPLIEIHPLKGEFFDYNSKYNVSGSEEIVPARISKVLAKKVQKVALKVYKEIGCRGFARVDFILKDNKYPIVLEINTIPGLTPMSLLPKAAKAYGFSYSDLLDRIIFYALK